MSNATANGYTTSQSAEIAHLFHTRVDLGVCFSGLTLLVYDYICTLDLEIRFVWSCPWSTGLALFYFGRYIPFAYFGLILYAKVSFMTLRPCLVITPLILWLITVGLLVSHAVIVLRTYAIWGCQRSIFYILVAWVITLPGALLALVLKTTVGIAQTVKDPGLSTNIKLKCSTAVPVHNGIVMVLVYCLINFLAEVAIFVLTAIKAKEHCMLAFITKSNLYPPYHSEKYVKLMDHQIVQKWARSILLHDSVKLV
ncbi:hypothetical protein CPB84DRAFT_1027525 [Gymnopilus junonius]|uniref:DUF6533 domain-containing protein n=1 Tax=Gymnopilus junonius TaxID=109634 RepID=A0A9P5NPJ5_GYMJU|nr:hypothetical protein CPB84DRAFT_1027525 [Gymnopilus junonius]